MVIDFLITEIAEKMLYAARIDRPIAKFAGIWLVVERHSSV